MQKSLCHVWVVKIRVQNEIHTSAFRQLYSIGKCYSEKKCYDDAHGRMTNNIYIKPTTDNI